MYYSYTFFHDQIGDHWYGSTSCDKFECQQGSDGQIQIKLTQQKCDTICDEVILIDSK